MLYLINLYFYLLKKIKSSTINLSTKNVLITKNFLKLHKVSIKIFKEIFTKDSYDKIIDKF